MKVNTRIEDALPDGTITHISFVVKNVISVAILRKNKDRPFIIDGVEVLSRDETQIREAIRAIQCLIHENGAEIEIPTINKLSNI